MFIYIHFLLYAKNICVVLKQGHRMEAGLIGLTFIAAGFPGAIMSGIFPDKTKMFK